MLLLFLPSLVVGKTADNSPVIFSRDVAANKAAAIVASAIPIPASTRSKEKAKGIVSAGILVARIPVLLIYPCHR